MPIDAVDELEDWHFAVQCAGIVPDAKTCIALLVAAPSSAEATPEYRLICRISQWREMRFSDAKILRWSMAWWDAEHVREAV